jgi:glycosyltransferase involved in cell wall biosynthesis
MKPHAAPPSISVIIPIGQRRATDIGALYREYRAGIAATGATHEFIFVLDGPRPEARRALEALLRDGEEFTIVNLTRNFGEAAALTAGFERSSGGTIVTLPAYPQIEPGDIRKLLAALSTADMAIGYRWPRYGNALDRMRRTAFHGLVNFVTGARLRDLGCGVRAMRRQVLEEIDLYGDQHRFLPILAMRLGFRVSEVPARQSAQDRHGRIYRPREYMHHLLDLFSIFFLMRFTKKPLRFFGMLGAATFGVGAVLIAYLGFDRLLFSEPLADRPALLLAALLLVLGMQVFALGLLGELIIFTHARGLKDYRVEEIIQYPDAVAASDSGSDALPEQPATSPEMRASAPPAITA